MNTSEDLEQVRQKIDAGVYTLSNKRKGTNKLWAIFPEIKKNDGSILEDYIYCSICKHIIKYNEEHSLNLKRHDCYLALSSEASSKLVSGKDKKEAVKTCAAWIVEDCRPVSVVQGNGFRKMIKFFIKIGARYGANVDVANLLPDSTAISQRINTIAEEKKNDIKMKMKQKIADGDASSTIHLWSDDFVKRNYICATLHYKSDSKIHDIVLGMKSMDHMHSSGLSVYTKLSSLFNEFDVRDLEPITFVTDRDSSAIKALQNNKRLNCTNHLLSNIIDSAFDATLELTNTIESCKLLAKYLKKANMLQMLETSVKSHCPTGWHSQFAMLKLIENNWPKINEILLQSEELNRTNKIDISLIKSLVVLCTDFDIISKKLQDSAYPTMNLVILSIEKIISVCQPSENDRTAIFHFKKKIIDGIQEDLMPNLSITHKAALFLYPPANHLQQSDMSIIKEYCEQEITKRMNSTSSPAALSTSQLSSESESDESSDNGMEFFLPQLINVIQEKPMEEIRRYAMLRVPMDNVFDAFKWWERYSKDYPNLAKLAFKLLSIPASNAASERVFSLAGNIIAEKRNHLGPTNISNILFLKSLSINDK